MRTLRWTILLVPLCLTAGCDDILFGVPRAGTEVPPADGFCGVQDVIATRCAGCHSAGAPDGGLDLATDPHAALVGQPATADASLTRVVAGDPSTSFLMAKLEGTQTLGGPMPPGPPLDATTIGVFRAWIADGAPGDCDDVDTDPPDGSSYYPHPGGWARANGHGHAFQLREEGYSDFCTTCHGADLTGGTGPSCDTCHEGGEAWRTDCTYCHGGELDSTGAPPGGIAGSPDAASFPPHSVHVQPGPKHDGFDCTACHTRPVDVLSPGHIFVQDTTPGVAEVIFAQGLSDAASWNAQTLTCTNAYCHGTGLGDDGTAMADDPSRTCHSCHADRTSSEDTLKDMSGEHDLHVWDAGVGCEACHSPTTADSTSIADVSLHVDGQVQVQPAELIWSGASCSGTCHSIVHDSDMVWD